MRYAIRNGIATPANPDDSDAVRYDQRTGTFTFQLGSGIGQPVTVTGLVTDTTEPWSATWCEAAAVVWEMADLAWSRLCH